MTQDPKQNGAPKPDDTHSTDPGVPHGLADFKPDDDAPGSDRLKSETHPVKE